MVNVIRGKYKRLSMRFNESGDLIVKAPKKLSDETISNFLVKHQSWIKRQSNKVLDKIKLKSSFDFTNSIYLLGDKIPANELNKRDEYRVFFKEYIENRVKFLSKSLNLNFNALSPTNSVRIWGSMDRKNNMKLNIKLAVLRKELIDYVIVHELCHSIEFNHSKRFWSRVEQIIPNYKELKKEISLYDFVLREDIF